MSAYKIAWLPGDGVGNEVMEAARITLEEVVRRFPQSGEARLAQARLDQMRKEGR